MPEAHEVERELEALRARIRAQNPSPGTDLTPLQKAISSVNANWHITARLPAPVNAPLAWRAIYLTKRVARRVMVELLNTVVQQQNAFNIQVARALTELAIRDNKIDELEKRIVELEERLTATESREPVVK